MASPASPMYHFYQGIGQNLEKIENGKTIFFLINRARELTRRSVIFVRREPTLQGRNLNECAMKK